MKPSRLENSLFSSMLGDEQCFLACTPLRESRTLSETERRDVYEEAKRYRKLSLATVWTAIAGLPLFSQLLYVGNAAGAAVFLGMLVPAGLGLAGFAHFRSKRLLEVLVDSRVDVFTKQSPDPYQFCRQLSPLGLQSPGVWTHLTYLPGARVLWKIDNKKNIRFIAKELTTVVAKGPTVRLERQFDEAERWEMLRWIAYYKERARKRAVFAFAPIILAILVFVGIAAFSEPEVVMPLLICGPIMLGLVYWLGGRNPASLARALELDLQEGPLSTGGGYEVLANSQLVWRYQDLPGWWRTTSPTTVPLPEPQAKVTRGAPPIAKYPMLKRR